MLIFLRLSPALCSGRLGYKWIHLSGFLRLALAKEGHGSETSEEEREDGVFLHLFLSCIAAANLAGATSLAGQPLLHSSSSYRALGTSFIHSPSLPRSIPSPCLRGVTSPCSCYSLVSQQPVLVLLTPPMLQLKVSS